MKPQRWLACRNLMPYEKSLRNAKVSGTLLGVLVGAGLLAILLLMMGCSGRRTVKAPVTPLGVPGCVFASTPEGSATLDCYPTWERQPYFEWGGTWDYPNRGMWQCPKGYWLAYQGREATLSETFDHNADTYCVREERP